MPTGPTLLTFVAASLALILVPGPNLLYIVTLSASHGRKIGLASAFGVETGTLIHVAAAALGLSALLASSALALDAVKYAGAAYLIYLGIRTLRSKDAPESVEQRPEGRSVAKSYLQGVLVNTLNPKVALFFLAFLPQFVDPDRGAVASQILVFGSVFFAIALSCDILYAVTASSLGGWLRGRSSVARRQRYIVGGVYLALAAATLATSPDRGGE